ncbi:MAG: mannose-6-phosphate isomerase [Actinoplanes sp.]|jgi:mannose-6-phosphate isomerase|nr:mannose-6-phosphate isomerase [Actinoplanes sp.]
MSGVHRLTGVIRPYAWGSRTALAQLQGRPAPTDAPEAELWLGAHPGDPSTLAGHDGPISLAEVIAQDPKGQLGPQVAAEFGPRLPYLMKVLAAAAPLSLQAHPDAEYARRAFAAQEADPDLPRNYTDAYHKPELLVALTPFAALCGFRDPAVSASVLAALDLPALSPVIEALRTGPPGLRDAVEILLTWPAADRPALIASVVAATRAGPHPVAPAGAGSGTPAGTSAGSELDAGGVVAAGFALAAGLAEHYPGDPGVLVALLLNEVHLEPGEAIWMPAGNLHAYLFGTGVEIMAASDNVLRGGLTPKRVDVGELLNVLCFEVLDDPILPATELAPGVLTWQVPVREFALYRIELDGTRPPTVVPAAGPRIVLGTAGDVHVAGDHGTPVEVSPGTAAFVAAESGPITLAGLGQTFVASVPS